MILKFAARGIYWVVSNRDLFWKWGSNCNQRIVEEAVHELKENEFTELIDEKVVIGKQKNETIMESDIEALIPDIYVESDAERLDIYRRLYRCTDAG